jgi:hypothetical protein
VSQEIGEKRVSSEKKATEFTRLFEEIESLEFETDVNMCSGFNSFIRNLEKNSAFQRLKEIPKEEIKKRVNRILAANIDRRFQHPLDTAIAAYYYVCPEAKEIIVSFPYYSWNWVTELFNRGKISC